MKLHSDEIIEKYEEAGVWGEETLLDLFNETKEEYPDRTAMVDPPNKEDLVGLEPERLSYEELAMKIDSVATSLRKLGVEKDDVVVVQLPNIWELAMLYLAISRAGAIISPLPVQWRERELEHVVGLTEAKVLITLKEFNGFNHLDLGEEIESKFSSLEHVLSLRKIRSISEGEVEGEELNEIEITGNDVFNIQWTSGTEAKPKACPMSHNNWLSCPVPPLTEMEEGYTNLCLAPLVNMTALANNFISWIQTKGTFVLHHPVDLEILIKQMKEEDVNYTIMVPTLLNFILKGFPPEELDLSHVDKIASGSAPLSEFALKGFKERWDVDLINIWGQNEGTGLVSGPLTTPLGKRVDQFPLFREDIDWGVDEPVIDQFETKIVDPETGNELREVGEVGELAFKSPLTMACYFKQPEMTENAFDEDGFFYTGDLFRVEEGNHISFFDRMKDVIIRGGFTISAQEIENIVLEVEKVEDAAAVAMPDPDLGEKACIYVVPKEGEEITLDEITSYMEDKVAVQKHPERLEIVDEIPRNPVGKILKAELRKDIQEKMEEEGGEN